MDRQLPAFPSVALVLLALVAPAANADVAPHCIEFAWDVRAEHLLFAMSPKLLDAGTDRATTPVVAGDRQYQVHLQPHAA